VLPETIYADYDRKMWRVMSFFEDVTSWYYFPEAKKISTVTSVLSKYYDVYMIVYLWIIA